MMTKQRLRFLTTVTIFLASAMPALAAAAPAPAPPKVEPAGKITALLPVARIARGAGRNLTTLDAKRDDQVIWNDKIKTEKGGRARITLNDQSILSLGSQAELTIVKHDARVQQTQLQLGYGRVRAEVSKITRQGGGFELRTPTAVAGVIGTDFGTEADNVGTTTFLCISGLVQVSNSDPNIAGSVQCAPGLTTTVTAGKAPTPPTNATPEQIQQLIQDTEPAIISAMLPMSALPGATLDATLNGTKMGSVKSVNVTPDAGVSVSLVGTPTDTSVTVHLVIAPNAEPGPRTIHLAKTSGADSAAVFTIMAPPTAAGGDFKKPYLELLGQIGTTSAGGLSAYLAQLQQTAAQAIQELQQRNAANASLADASTAFNSQVSTVQSAITDAVNQINTAVTQADSAFQSQYDAAYKALLQRRPDGAADDEFNNAIKTSYDSIASALGNTIKAINGNLTQLVTQANTNIAQTQQTFLQQLAISPPVPAVNFTERNIDVGAALGQAGIPALDAGNSKGTNGASIVSYKWVLCDPSYKPAQVGIPLVGSTTGCNPVQGYTSSSSDFQFQTCSLAPNDYVARVLVTDSNNQQAAMDVKLHILAPTYDDPATLVRNLAQAYTTLQPNNFLAYFDQTAFAGFTALSENVRNTFPTLASMQINPRISQAAITCNDATVRADWVQNYTYKANAEIAFSQSEQLSMRMLRTPGKGWFITDFQGDNGTVQGQLPGPAVTEQLVPAGTGTANYVITSIGFTGRNAPYTGANALQLGETTSVFAVVQNVGNASPSGTITLVASCKPVNTADTTSCQGSLTTTVSAPAAGQSVTATMVDNSGPAGGGGGGDLPGSFIGTVALTTSIPQDTSDDSASLNFDQCNFFVSIPNRFTPQYIVPGTSQTFTVATQVLGTTPFAIPVTLATTTAYPGITVTPASTTVNGTQVITVTAAPGTPTGFAAVAVTGTNRGVSRAQFPGFSVINPQLNFTKLFLNDANNPLVVQVGPTAATVAMQLSGAAFSGLATISIPPVTGFTVNPDVTSIAANGTFNVSFTAAAATSVVVPVTVNAILPNTNPPISISKIIFVKGVGASDLQLVSATTTLTGAWIDGQGADYVVTVRNNSAVPSAGNESVHIDVNGITVGSTTIGSLAAGASTQVNIHAVLPDLHGDSTFTGTGTLKVKVEPDPLGDTDYTNNSITSNVSLANWHIALNQSSPVQVNTTTTGGSTVVYFSGTVDGSSIANYSALGFNPSQGQVGSTFTLSNFVAPGDPACGRSTPANTLFCSTAATASGTLQPGLYYVQLIVTLTDPNTGQSVRRQATVPLQVDTGNNGTNVTLASSANNCSGVNCTTTGSTLQINGALAEQFSITLDMTCTTVGVAGLITSPCAGAADLAIHDASNTETTALGSVQAVPTGTPLILRVAPAVDPNGNIVAGPASGYAIGISGANYALAGVRRNQSPISPDPVGTQVPFTINVGDIGINANTGPNLCTGVAANGSPLQLTVNWVPSGGFNAGTLTWEWENASHSLVGGSPLSFSQSNGTTTGSGTYSPVTFTLSNVVPQDGIQAYYLAVTISNGTSTATKYFPFYFDLSLTQNFCGAVSSARGFNPVQGSWLRSAAGFGGPVASAAQLRAEVSAGIPDVHISAADVSFTPSIPKVGDQVQVRFKASNTGDADATGLPIALQVNGATVAIDTFDIPKGRSVLGGLTWTASADVVPAASGADSAQMRIKGKLVDPDSVPQGADVVLGIRPVAVQAAVVVDPLHTRTQKSALDKSAALSHFSIRGSGPATASSGATGSSQRMLVELEDGACLGLRLSSGGIMPCGSADLEVTIADLAKSLLSLDTLSGVGDLGATFAPGSSSVKFTAQAAGMAGHTYAVQLPNGKTATVNVESVRNPAELDAKARALFRATAARIMRSMGDSSTAPNTGDLTGGGSHPTVFIVLNVQGM